MSAREVMLSTRGAVDSGVATRLAAELRSQRTLGDVLGWARRQQPTRDVAEIVTHDEYTHDVIIAWERDVWLVFDTT